MGGCPEKGERITADPGFAMHHQLPLLTGSLPAIPDRRKKSPGETNNGTPAFARAGSAVTKVY
jgi:hypothetical protein